MILLHIFMICMVSIATAADVTYVCTTGKIAINTQETNTNDTFHAAVAPQDNNIKNDNCTHSWTLVGDLSFTGCDETDVFILYLMTHTTDMENTLNVGKLQTYKLNCTGLTGNQTLTENFTINTSSSPEPAERILLNMTIEPTKIELGKLMNITITELQATTHQLNVVSCNASTMDLKENIALITDSKIVETNLVAEVTNGATGVAKIWLYGFRFSSSPSVMISCDVTICTVGDSSCQTQTTGTGKKRNADQDTDADDYIVTQTVVGQFEVSQDDE